MTYKTKHTLFTVAYATVCLMVSVTSSVFFTTTMQPVELLGLSKALFLAWVCAAIVGLTAMMSIRSLWHAVMGEQTAERTKKAASSHTAQPSKA